ncbi:hypothetical protein [Peptostreptococcus faecalis]|uniref:hypothetical protein n=1 Tax=Peptostreptococcus faecalis TaxID=2045015 RepID=UPI000C7CE93F|nr:hypothetical protein [Peptostreptococcus faecalis]
MIEESRLYKYDYRMVTKGKEGIKIFSNYLSLNVTSELSFDIKNEELTSLDHFNIALGTSIIFSILSYDKKNGNYIYDIEGKFDFILSNPLSYLGVVGCDEEVRINEIEATLYIDDLDEIENIEEYCTNGLKQSVLYNSTKNSIKFNLKFKSLG